MTPEHIFSKRCEYCEKFGHTNMECWSTRGANQPKEQHPKSLIGNKDLLKITKLNSREKNMGGDAT